MEIRYNALRDTQGGCPEHLISILLQSQNLLCVLYYYTYYTPYFTET